MAAFSREERARKRLPKIFSALTFALVLLPGVPAFAQVGEGAPDPSSVRVRMGPLLMNPRISLTNVGVDDNVFNDPANKDPKRDFTFTLTPVSDFWLRLGPTWIDANLTETLNWYEKYESERNANTGVKVGWIVPGSRMSFRIDGRYLDAHDRPGYEIDTRASRTEAGYSGAFDFHVMSKSFIGVTASRIETHFDQGTEYNGTDLQVALDRVDTTYGVNFRHDVTPLTSITFSGTHVITNFDHSPNRDTVSNSALMAVSFKPEALLKGGFSLGYDDLAPTDSSLPDYRGFVGNVDLTYVLLGSTRFAVTGGRGVQYSYDDSQPYYIQSRIAGSVTQQVYGPLDVEARGEIASLDYRDRSGVAVAAPDRSDHIRSYGAGVGYHLAKDLRLSFNVDQYNRDSQMVDHQYDKLLFGFGLSYGF
jgi:hypothetical protein